MFLSADSVLDDTDAFLYPTEFLNTILPSGLPPHKLKLKIGAPIMLLRNMNGSKGQVNGTRMVVRGFGHVVDAKIDRNQYWREGFYSTYLSYCFRFGLTFSFA